MYYLKKTTIEIRLVICSDRNLFAYDFFNALYYDIVTRFIGLPYLSDSVVNHVLKFLYIYLNSLIFFILFPAISHVLVYLLVQVFKAEHPGLPLRVYFLNYEASIEEQQYLTSLK